ncbi:DUF1801 domain-containing protein [Anaerosporobacter sp.]
MNIEFIQVIEKYNDEIKTMFSEISEIIKESVSVEVQEILWAKLPSFYVGNNFVRLIPFKDHLNIEAEEIQTYTSELSSYKITPKGMLQIYIGQDIPKDILLKAFRGTMIK